jgi:hypothetical protein
MVAHESISPTDPASMFRALPGRFAVEAAAAKPVALRLAPARTPAAAAPAPACPRWVRWDATWKAGAVGAVAALPLGPVFGVAASALEAGLLAELEARALARLGVANATTAANDATAALLRPGTTLLVLRAGARKALVDLAEHAAGRAVRLAVKELGLALPRLASRTVFGVAAPVVSVATSAACNMLDMHRRLTPAVLACEALEVATPRPVLADAEEVAGTATWGGAVLATA